jgi:hypothetical protein
VRAARSILRRVGDLAILHGHVEIDPHEHALVLGIERIERLERHRHIPLGRYWLADRLAAPLPMPSRGHLF